MASLQSTAVTQDSPPRSEDLKPARAGSHSGHADDDFSMETLAEKRGTIRILIVDDERTMRESCASILEAEGYQVRTSRRAAEAVEVLEKGQTDIVLVDLFMEEMSGLEILKKGLDANPLAVGIVMTGNPSVASSLKAMREGAWNYLPKPFSATQLTILVGRAAHTIVVSRESERARADRDRRAGHSSRITLLGESPAFKRAIELAQKVASTDASVFLSGESGTGKELFTQFIHHNSRRSSRDLVSVNSAAIPENLLESEMFGHVKGAFTGATRDKPGLLEVAHGGTLFLDEITEMTQAVQAKLLRVIQDGLVRRVGSHEVDAVVDIRIVAATNVNPTAAVTNGKLRRDLFFRLQVFPIHIPPLRERPEDIPLLAEHFLEVFWRRHRGADLPRPRFCDDTAKFLKGRHWPGNVRELRNAVERAVVTLDPGSEIRPHDLAFLDDDQLNDDASQKGEVFRLNRGYHEARDHLLEQFERKYLTHVLQRAKGEVTSAAEFAGVDPATLYRLMRKHDTNKYEILQGGGG